MNDWNRLDAKIVNCSPYLSFENVLIKLITVLWRKILTSNCNVGAKLLIRLLLSFNYLRKQNFRNNIEDNLNPLL